MATLKNFIRLLCLTLTFFDFGASRPNPERRAVHENISEIVRKDYRCDHDTINRTECENIMSNALLVDSHSRLKRMANLAESLDRQTSCPDFSGSYLTNPNLTPGERSLSPFTHTIDHDAHRIPRYISQAKCLCVGCINPRTLSETRTLRSESIKVTVAVYERKPDNTFVRGTADITVGCTCAFPPRSGN